MAAASSAELGLEVDGVGGILPGDIIHTDYIQNKYKLPLTAVNPNIPSAEGLSFPAVYFKVMGTIQKVDISGWTTEIRSQMIMNKLPPDLELEFKTPVDKPKSLENKQDFVPEEVKNALISADDNSPMSLFCNTPANKLQAKEEHKEFSSAASPALVS